ncbi:MAG: DEAD/DEAH box helicase [Fimbriimonadaceae bacterium]|nr:DEAD/DEAH box helicase [Fimbriimonadaceae bacterium]
MPVGSVIQKADAKHPYALLRQYSDWGLEAVDLAAPPRRFWADTEAAEPPVEVGVEVGAVRSLPTPAELLSSLPSSDNWQAQGRRSLARLQAYFLLAEDPQRRLDAREVDTLSHQVSLVSHILQNENLRRVLIADEVGLGKTVEAGLILREVLQQRPETRVLYLAPARLVSNVRTEFDRLKLPFRQWSAQDADARLTDPKIIASIHRAVHGDNFDRVIATMPWDVIIVDECHHLSAWEQEGGKPSEAYRLVKELIDRQGPEARVILMSGTPHQGHETRFENLLNLLRATSEQKANLSGRVIYRTKDDIRDWDGHPVFPNRMVNEPLLIDLGVSHREWMSNIHDFYRPPMDWRTGQARRRAAGWRCAQAMQWAASSPHAGLGYLTRQAVRAGWNSSNSTLRGALAELRPYRLGPPDEDTDSLFRRIYLEVVQQQRDADVDDIEDYVPGDPRDTESQRGLEQLIQQGISLVRSSGDDKWEIIKDRLLDPAGDEKVVLFAQPIETVTALARFLERQTGRRPSLIIGGQDDSRRRHEVDAFRRTDGPQYLVSSRAGGEGINLQVARRLIHIDVPWNPMDMEQRVGRIHRFGSRETIIVDTVVVQDSREADAYRIAREKLKLITKTLVEPERFENVFGRVMGLLGQDELQDILLNAPAAPFSAGDQSRLTEMVQDGFWRWKRFHDKYGEQQKSIGRQNPGEATWTDVKRFMTEHGGATVRDGFRTTRFRRDGNAVRRVEEDAEVLSLGDHSCYVCADYSESLVFGPDGSVTPKLGLNLPSVCESLRKVAFPNQPAGAAWLRLPSSSAELLGSLPAGVLVLARLTLKRDVNGQWTEASPTLHVYRVAGAECAELVGSDKGKAVRLLLDAVVRKNAESDMELVFALKKAEADAVQLLWKPSAEELPLGIRHAVMPLFAAVVTQ